MGHAGESTRTATRSLYFGKVYFGLRTESGGGECVVTNGIDVKMRDKLC